MKYRKISKIVVICIVRIVTAKGSCMQQICPCQNTKNWQGFSIGPNLTLRISSIFPLHLGNDKHMKFTVGTLKLKKGKQDIALVPVKSYISKSSVMQLKGVYLTKISGAISPVQKKST